MAHWKTVLIVTILDREYYKYMSIKFLSISKIAMFLIAMNSYITSAATINQWQGVVTYVTDGDTLWIRPTNVTPNSEPKKIRISGIDAPESCQLYGNQSTAALKKLVALKTVSVVSKRFDDYGRDVAQVSVNGLDVGAWMVGNGHAWSYHSRHSAGPYRIEEESATRSRLGLFNDASAVEPRFFRKEHGSCHPTKNSANANAENTRKRYK
jgi:micrococcal nuclease